MNKVKFFMLTSIMGKFAIVASIYYTVFKASPIAGLIVLFSHLVYELSEFIIEREMHKQGEKAVQQLYEKLTMGSGGGHC